MSAMPDSTLADPKDRLIADLERQLAECRSERDEALVERDEALAQQAATAEVLHVINSSPGDLAPVFDAMLEKAIKLCDAARGTLRMYDGQAFLLVAARSDPALVELARQEGPLRPQQGAPLLEIVQGQDVVHVSDIKESEYYHRYLDARERIDVDSIRSLLIAALRKEGKLLGTLQMYRNEVRPFSDKQIALLQNFAAQAVIAIENARLLNELRDRTRDLQESLEYQTAISDVLKVISRSTFDLHPVLDTLLNTAGRLCNAQSGHLTLRDGDVYRVASTFMFSTEWDAHIRQQTLVAGRGSIVGRAVMERRPVLIPDVTVDPEYIQSKAIALGNLRTLFAVPLLREGEPIGTLASGD